MAEGLAAGAGAVVPLRPRNAFRPVGENGEAPLPKSWRMERDVCEHMATAIGEIHRKKEQEIFEELLGREGRATFAGLVAAVSTEATKKRAERALADGILHSLGSFYGRVEDPSAVVSLAELADKTTTMLLALTAVRLWEEANGVDLFKEAEKPQPHFQGVSSQKASFQQASATSSDATFWQKVMGGATVAPAAASTAPPPTTELLNITTAATAASAASAALPPFAEGTIIAGEETNSEHPPSQGHAGNSEDSSQPPTKEALRSLLQHGAYAAFAEPKAPPPEAQLSPWCKRMDMERALRNCTPELSQRLSSHIEALYTAVKLSDEERKRLAKRTTAVEIEDLLVSEIRKALEEISPGREWEAKWTEFWDSTVYRGDRIDDEEGTRNNGVRFVDAVGARDEWVLVAAEGGYGYGVPGAMQTAPLAYAQEYMRCGHRHLTVPDCSALPEDCELYAVVDFLLQALHRLATELLANPRPENEADETIPFVLRTRSHPHCAQLLALLAGGGRAVYMALGENLLLRWRPDWEHMDLGDDDILRGLGLVRQPCVKAA